MLPEGESSPSSTNPRSTLIITAAVIITILLAIILALGDSLQLPLPAPIQPTVLSGFIGVETPFSEFLPTGTPTPTGTATAAVPPAAERQPEIKATPTVISVLAFRTCGNVPAGWVPYVVRPGDSLFRLSLNSGATISEIVQANCLDMNVLYSGTRIFLPSSPPPRPPCGPPQSWRRYLVQRGDTLYSLARINGTTVFAIMQANCLVSSRIDAGRYLFLPPSSVTATPVPTPEATPSATSPPAATATKKATATPATPDPTATATNTPGATSTTTPTETATASPTPSLSNTHTATPTPMPSFTHTPLPSHTATAFPTPTHTPSPTSTPTSTPTATPSPSPTPSDTPTPSATPATTQP